jgi:hypothetical protein
MKLNLSIDLKKLAEDLKGPKGVSALTEEMMRISSELKKFRDEVKPDALARLKKAEAQGQDILKKLKSAQANLEKEIKHQISQVKAQANSAEAKLKEYKKLAATAFSQSSQKTSKKSSGKKATAKASKTSPRKKTMTTKKKVSSKKVAQ